MRIRSIFLAIVALALVNSAKAQFSEAEQSMIDQSLSLSNLQREDLTWPRMDATKKDPWCAPLITLALEKPFVASEAVMELHASTGTVSVRTTLLRMEEVVFGGRLSDIEPGILTKGIVPAEIPASLAYSIDRITQAIMLANKVISKATSKLEPADRRALIESLPMIACEDPTIKFDFVKTPAIDWKSAISKLNLVDLVAIRSAAGYLAEIVDQTTPLILSVNADVKEPINILVNGIPVRVYGKNDDIHTHTDAMLVIDLGGNDRYEGRVGAGVGYASVFLDLAGDDTYETRDVSLGAGIFGIGLGRDLAGNDNYNTKSLSLGSAIAGVGAWIDSSGVDTYRSVSLSQGWGMFGEGILIDLTGNDFYSIELQGQGSARTSGVGLLVDRDGNDIYKAGGRLLNSPLFSDVHYSFSQGFGMGYREDSGGLAGGVGMLTDLNGNDAYIADTYAQGASYWLSIGSLFDGGGHDTYTAYHYAQSSAMHSTAAFLFDLAGDDIYGVKFGASHAIGHDYSVAFLMDRSGNDSYFSRSSQPGLGNANGIGIFMDVAGDDRYQGPPGVGNLSRGSGSFGLFIDGSGLDQYQDGLADGEAAVRNSWAAAMDFPNGRMASNVPVTSRKPYPPVGSIDLVTEGELVQIYRRATQWSVGTAIDEVQTNVGQLIGMGMPAVNWMLDTQLAKSDRLSNRTFVEVLKSVGSEAIQALLKKMQKGSSAEIKNGLSIATDGGFDEVSQIVPSLINDPSYQLQATRAAGVLKVKEAVPALLILTAKPTQIGLVALISLEQIGDERSYSTAEALALLKSLPTRKSALSLMAKFPDKALETARRFLLADKDSTIRVGIELLGMIATEEALSEVVSRIGDPNPGVRISVILALQGKCPTEAREAFLNLRNDPDPLVKAIALRADPGRG